MAIFKTLTKLSLFVVLFNQLCVGSVMATESQKNKPKVIILM